MMFDVSNVNISSSRAVVPTEVLAVLYILLFLLAVIAHGRQVEWTARLDFLWQCQVCRKYILYSFIYLLLLFIVFFYVFIIIFLFIYIYIYLFFLFIYLFIYLFFIFYFFSVSDVIIILLIYQYVYFMALLNLKLYCIKSIKSTIIHIIQTQLSSLFLLSIIFSK